MSSNIDLKSLQSTLLKGRRLALRHAVFAVIMLVLITYLFIVWQINQDANAQPSTQDTTDISTQIPKIDKNAITQIQALENNSPEVHSLFNQARNNPFQE